MQNALESPVQTLNEQIVFQSENEQVVTNSLLVAEKFGKRHANVLRAIDDLISQMPETQRKLNFAFIKNEVSLGRGITRKDPMYIMTRDGFSLLVMGFTGSEALRFKLQFIDAFNRMEAELKKNAQIPQNFAEALRLAAAQAEELETKTRQLESQKPKVLFADAVAASKTSILIGDLAKILCQNGISIGQNRLFEWLRKNDYLLSFGDYYNMPAQRYVEQGLFEIKQTTINNPDGSIRTTRTCKVTGKGQQYFVNKWLNNQKQEGVAL